MFRIGTISLIFFLIGSAELKKNILLIVLDDFRPAIKSGYEDFRAHTPYMDKLITKSAIFKRIYAQQALCAPSRNSLLTSRRPDSLHLYDFNSYWRTFASNFTTMPQYFKDHEYFTKSVGKIFHPGVSSNFTDDFPLSWSEPTYHPSTETFMNKPVCIDATGILKKNLLCPVELMFQPEKTLPDIQSLLEAKEFLKIPKSKPFFLAVGFHKPHIPFKFPLKYLNFHPIEKFNESTFRPFNVPEVSWNPYNDLRERNDVQALNLNFPYGPIERGFASQIRQHYYASVTYVDDLLGQLLKEVNFADTMIVLTSDHGWSLGEHEEWAKYSNYEVALNVPLIIFDPENSRFGGKSFNNIGELVDLFPTLVDLARLPALPSCEPNCLTCTEGKSLVPYMMETMSLENDAAFSQFPRPSEIPSRTPNSDKPKLSQINIMGYSIRTDQFRYTVWIKFVGKTFRKNWSKIYGEELYDHSFDAKENMNLANRELFKNIKIGLMHRLASKFPNLKRT